MWEFLKITKGLRRAHALESADHIAHCSSVGTVSAATEAHVPMEIYRPFNLLLSSQRLRCHYSFTV